MWLDPLLPSVPQVKEFDPQDKTLWLEALARPEAEMRRQAADAIGQAACAGMPDLTDAAAKIAATLDSDTRPVVRHACAQALARMNAREYAATLLKHDDDDWQTMLIADAALADWNDAAAMPVWLARLGDSHMASLAVRSALGALAKSEFQDPKQQAPIQAIALDPARDPALRLEAAETLAHIRPNLPLENQPAPPDVEKMVSSHDLTDRLVAATILDPKYMTGSSQALLQLADDPEPMVIAVAARRLMLYDAKLLAPLDEKLSTNEDYAVRKLAVQVLTAQRSTPAVGLLAKMMDDPNREIREAARDALLSLDSDPALAGAVSDGAVSAVSAGPDDWRGIEQGLLLLGSIGDHHADSRVVELLADPRSALRIAAVVAVRRLRITSALPQLTERCAAIESTFKAQEALIKKHPERAMANGEYAALAEEGSQIAQTLGQMNYASADPALRTLIPKDPAFPSSMRAAGIWALGRLHAGTPDNALVGQLMERATDHSMMMPEAPEVQTMAVEAVGMMHARQPVSRLQEILTTGASDQLAAACRWAIAQITGQPMPPPPPEHFAQHGYFLEAVH